MLSRLFGHGEDRRAAADVYARIVDQSRLPVFYDRWGVPDTVDGRFDLLVLHAFVVFHRLADAGDAADRFAQRLFDHMFGDMDRNLREMGVGDLSVGKKVKFMAKGFYGRVVAYRDAITAGGPAVDTALLKNLYAGVDPGAPRLAAMTAYLHTQVEAMARTPVEAIVRGDVVFGAPSESGRDR